jgi:hypothetical protein
LPGSEPRSCMRLMTSGDFSTFSTAAISRAFAGYGIFAGATKP